MKKNGDEPVRPLMHIYMEVPQETPWVAILNKQKYHFFSFYKNGGQESGTGPDWGVWYQWEGEDMGKEYGRENIEQILCTHV
jgi:hypothetical protein